MIDLAGKVVVVTGAGSGMGRAIAVGLAGAGSTVIAMGRTESKLLETRDLAEKSAKQGGRVIPLTCDITKRDQIEARIDHVEKEVGPIAILVNNAGSNVRVRTLREMSDEAWDTLIQNNLTGTFWMMRAVLPHFRARRAGQIINISSIAGLRPLKLAGAAYAASKYGVNALSGVLSQEEVEFGIRSTVICPGEVNTPILDDRPVPVPAEKRAVMLQPEDVAEAVLFVARLHERAHVPELILTPSNNPWV